MGTVTYMGGLATYIYTGSIYVKYTVNGYRDMSRRDNNSIQRSLEPYGVSLW